ncbi:MAG: hypothetical protein HY794_13295 [Desulfarculus sp.]|nr:hypothetical protein [Desulfarculus sp.]
MAIRYSEDVQTYKSTLRDAGAGVTIEFEFSRPTTRQITAYNAGCVTRRGKTVVMDRVGAAVRHLPEVLRGFTFPMEGEAIEIEVEGQWVPLSCVPGEPGYRRDWFAVLERVESKLLVELGINIFHGVYDISRMDDMVRGLAENLAGEPEDQPQPPVDGEPGPAPL